MPSKKDKKSKRTSKSTTATETDALSLEEVNQTMSADRSNDDQKKKKTKTEKDDDSKLKKKSKKKKKSSKKRKDNDAEYGLRVEDRPLIESDDDEQDEDPATTVPQQEIQKGAVRTSSSRSKPKKGPALDAVDETVEASDIAFPLQLSRGTRSMPGAFPQAGTSPDLEESGPTAPATRAHTFAAPSPQERSLETINSSHRPLETIRSAHSRSEDSTRTVEQHQQNENDNDNDDFLVTAYLVTPPPEAEIMTAQVSGTFSVGVPDASEQPTAQSTDFFDNESAAEPLSSDNDDDDDSKHASGRKSRFGSNKWLIILVLLAVLIAVVVASVSLSLALSSGGNDAEGIVATQVTNSTQEEETNDDDHETHNNTEAETTNPTPSPAGGGGGDDDDDDDGFDAQSAFDTSLLTARDRVSFHVVQWGHKVIACDGAEWESLDLECKSHDSVVVVLGVDSHQEFLHCHRDSRQYVYCELDWDELHEEDTVGSFQMSMLVACAGEEEDDDAMMLKSFVGSSTAFSCGDPIHREQTDSSYVTDYRGDSLQWVSAGIFCANDESALELRSDNVCDQGLQHRLPQDLAVPPEEDGTDPLPSQTICYQKSSCEVTLTCSLSEHSCVGSDTCDIATNTAKMTNYGAVEPPCSTTDPVVIASIIADPVALWELVSSTFVYGEAIALSFESAVYTEIEEDTGTPADYLLRVKAAYDNDILDEKVRASYHAVEWGRHSVECEQNGNWSSLELSCASSDAVVVVADHDDGYVECHREDQNLILCDMVHNWDWEVLRIVVACGGDVDDDNAMGLIAHLPESTVSECSHDMNTHETAEMTFELYRGDAFQWVSIGVFCISDDNGDVELRLQDRDCVEGSAVLLPDDFLPLNIEGASHPLPEQTLCLDHAFCETYVNCSLSGSGTCQGDNVCETIVLEVESFDDSHISDAACSVVDHNEIYSPLTEDTEWHQIMGSTFIYDVEIFGALESKYLP